MRYVNLEIVDTFSNTLTNMPVTFDSVCICYFVSCFFASFVGGGGCCVTVIEKYTDRLEVLHKLTAYTSNQE